MSYHKRVIVDFDDTLAFTTNRDWMGAKPNKPLIAKLNKLHNEGWQIDIFTARGSLSCKTRKEAEEKYLDSMLMWLLKHNVKYDIVSFNKPLGAYYIDDKAITPEDFVNVNIEQLEGGLSGSDIFTDGKLVHKQDDNAHDVKTWFGQVGSAHVPVVDRIVGNTLTMEYVPHDKEYFANNPYVALGLVQEKLEMFKTIYDYPTATFDDYVQRICAHAIGSDYVSELDKLVLSKLLYQIPLTPGFGHGDFGVTNLLFNNDKLKMIDPITETFTCTELDVAKFIASLYINKYSSDLIDLAYNTLSVFNNIPTHVLDLFISTELTRIVKYHPDKEFVMEQIRNVVK